MGNATITPSIPIILASASKIRSEILQKTGMEFSVIISDIDEDKLKKKILNKSIPREAIIS
jgi:predicted house-cleaning NTP pyrophosphatase (Maf/HAM1 superfamily)